MDEILRISVVNFHEYLRTDVGRSSWIRFQWNFFTGNTFFDFTAEDRLCWVYILCTAAETYCSTGSADFEFSSRHFTTFSTMQEISFHQAIEKLKRKRLITVRTSRGRYVGVTQTFATNETNETNERNTKIPEPPPAASEPLFNSAPPPPPRPPKKKAPTEEQRELNRRIWEAFEAAVLERHGHAPARHAQVNAGINKLREKLGEHAVQVVQFYVESNKAFYVEHQHALGFCLRDADSLYLQWKKGRAITEADVQNVREFNKSQTTPVVIKESVLAIELVSRCQKAVSDFGYDQGTAAKAFLGEFAWAGVVYQGGWRNFCVKWGEDNRSAQLRDFFAAQIALRKPGATTVQIGGPAQQNLLTSPQGEETEFNEQ